MEFVDTLRDRKDAAAQARRAKGGGKGRKIRSGRFRHIAVTIPRNGRGHGGHSMATLLQAEKGWRRVRKHRLGLPHVKAEDGGADLGGASPQADRGGQGSKENPEEAVVVAPAEERVSRMHLIEGGTEIGIV